MKTRILALIVALGVAFGVSAIVTENAQANPSDWHYITICYQGETLVVPAWKVKHGEYPGATEGECEPDTTPPPCEPNGAEACEPPPDACLPEADCNPCDDTDGLGHSGAEDCQPPDKTPPPPGGGTTGGDPGTPQGELPYTGLPTWPFIAGGLVLVLAGLSLAFFHGAREED